MCKSNVGLTKIRLTHFQMLDKYKTYPTFISESLFGNKKIASQDQISLNLFVTC